MGPRGNAGVAWAVITVLVLLALTLPRLAGEPADPTNDPLGEFMMDFQGQYLVGAADRFRGYRETMYSQARQLNTGSIPQRQRFIVLAAELAGPDEAQRRLEQLDQLLEQAAARPDPLEPTPEQRQVQEALYVLYATGPEDQRPNLQALTADQRDVLVQELGWFGELSLLPRTTDDQAARRAVLAPARAVAIILMSVMLALIAAMAVGFALLIAMIIATATGAVRSGFGIGSAHHGIYAETFAVWMLLFAAVQVVAGTLAQLMPQAGMLIFFGGFFLSLLALAWPVLRGVPWNVVQQDVGLTLGRRPLLEPLIGVAGYVAALPLLLVGVVLTFLLMTVQSLFVGPAQPLDPVGGPAHPVVEEIAGAGWWPMLQVFLLAAVAAPVVEEIIFRGVFYRHLRDATGSMHRWASVLASATINSFIFAIIHPQGWVAVPALMSLSYAFSLVREWRGTVVPAIVIHAVSNGIIVGMLITIARQVG